MLASQTLQLPRSPNIVRILDKWTQTRRGPEPAEYGACDEPPKKGIGRLVVHPFLFREKTRSEMAKGFRVYFDRALPLLLLCEAERPQYHVGRG